MTKQHVILKTDVILQMLAFAGLAISLFVSFISDHHQEFFVMMVMFLAVVQVLSALTIGLLYKDQARKNYLKVLFWLQGMGTLLLALIFHLELKMLFGLASFLFVINWLLSPFFLAIWSFYNSMMGLRKYEAEAAQEQEYV